MHVFIKMVDSWITCKYNFVRVKVQSPIILINNKVLKIVKNKIESCLFFV